MVTGVRALQLLDKSCDSRRGSALLNINFLSTHSSAFHVSVSG